MPAPAPAQPAPPLSGSLRRAYGSWFLVDVETGLDSHPHRLVQPVRAGQALRVDAKAGTAEASPPELVERVQEQRAPDPTSAPRATHAEQPHGRGLGVTAPRVADREAGRLLSVEREEPQPGIEPRSVEQPVGPVFEALLDGLPRVLEGLLLRLVEHPPVTVPEGSDLDALGPDRILGRIGEVDRHPHRVPDERVPALLERSQDLLVRRPAPGDEPMPLRAGALLCPVEDRRGRATVNADPDPPLAEALELRVPVAVEARVRRDVEPLRGPYGAHVVDRQRVGRRQTHDPSDLRKVLRGRGSQRAPAGTSSSSASARPLSDARVRSGRSSAGSSRRLIQMLGIPSFFAVAMSWNRLCATCTCAPVSAPVCSRNASQCFFAGLYEPISPATIEPSKSTPIASIDASRRSRSVFERIASFQPWSFASASAVAASSNTGQPGNDRASTDVSPSSIMSPSSDASCSSATVRTSR